MTRIPIACIHLKDSRRNLPANSSAPLSRFPQVVQPSAMSRCHRVRTSSRCRLTNYWPIGPEDSIAHPKELWNLHAVRIQLSIRSAGGRLQSDAVPAPGRELRRRPEFQVTSCPLDADVILRVVGSAPVEVAILNADNPRDGWPDMTVVRRLHLAHPEIAEVILLDTYDREIVVNAFRSGARGLFCFSQHPFRCCASASTACARDRFGPTANRCGSLSNP